jgi:hypothetical protein
LARDAEQFGDLLLNDAFARLELAFCDIRNDCVVHLLDEFWLAVEYFHDGTHLIMV